MHCTLPVDVAGPRLRLTVRTGPLSGAIYTCTSAREPAMSEARMRKTTDGASGVEPATSCLQRTDEGDPGDPHGQWAPVLMQAVLPLSSSWSTQPPELAMSG